MILLAEAAGNETTHIISPAQLSEGNPENKPHRQLAVLNFSLEIAPQDLPTLSNPAFSRVTSGLDLVACYAAINPKGLSCAPSVSKT